MMVYGRVGLTAVVFTILVAVYGVSGQVHVEGAANPAANPPRAPATGVEQIEPKSSQANTVGTNAQDAANPADPAAEPSSSTADPASNHPADPASNHPADPASNPVDPTSNPVDPASNAESKLQTSPMESAAAATPPIPSSDHREGVAKVKEALKVAHEDASAKDNPLELSAKAQRRFPRVRLREREWAKLGKEHVWANNIMAMLENAAKEMVPSHSLVFDIKAGDFELFYFDVTPLDVERNATAQGDLFVTSGLDETVEFRIRDPMNEYIFSREKTFEAHFKVKLTKHGQYTIMVRTQAHQPRRVSLSYSISHNEKPTHGHVQPDDVLRVWESLGIITRGVAEVEKMQEHMEQRTRAHLATQRSTNTRVIRFTMVEMAVMLLVMVVQILIIRNFKYRSPGSQWRV